MTVYVDDAYLPCRIGPVTVDLCRMSADTADELLGFARGLGVGFVELDDEGSAAPHCVVTRGARTAAVAAGAVEVSREWMIRWTARRVRADVAPAYDAGDGDPFA